MSDQADSSNNANAKKRSAINIPTMEEVERLRANRPKLTPSFFKSKQTLQTEDSTAPASPSASASPHLTFQRNSPINRIANPQSIPISNSPANNNNSPRATTASNPTLPTSFKRATGNAILVSPTQQKNPVLKHVHNVPWELSDTIKADYVVGQTAGVVYLSLRYHRLYPTYIYDRLNSLKKLYVSRILLVYVDLENYHDAMREINRIAILSDFTLMLAWSLEEAGRYLETYKAFENKGPDLIRERVNDEYLAKMTDCLTNIKSINKTDVLTLLSTFGSLKQVMDAETDQLAMCPGFGEQKVKRLQQAWKQPFLANKK